jgi:hypothetical protein
VKRLAAALAVLMILGVGLFLAAAAHEVASLGKRLTGRIGRLEGPVSRAWPGARAGAPALPPSGPAGAESPFTTVRITLRAEDLGDLLRQSSRSLGGALARTRDVQVRLGEGRVVVDSRNRLVVLGVPVADYGGHSEWALAALPDGVGVALEDLRVAGLPVPGATAWLRSLSGRRRDGWVVVPTGPRRVIERIDIAPGRLTVSGRVR